MNKTNPQSWFGKIMGKVRIDTPRISTSGLIRNDCAKGKLPDRVAKPGGRRASQRVKRTRR